MSMLKVLRLPIAQKHPPRLFQALPTRTLQPSVSTCRLQSRSFYRSPIAMASFDKPVATLDTAQIPRLPESSPTLFEAKKAKKLTFEKIAKQLGREEVAIAALFYGQAKASAEDVQKLSQILDIPHAKLEHQLYGWPDRGKTMEMPPKEPLIYRLYEIVQNYGYAYKAILNEKFGDGIMSAITFSTTVKKETDDVGDWVVITMRGKWLPYKRF